MLKLAAEGIWTLDLLITNQPLNQAKLRRQLGFEYGLQIKN
jgi:hypothetical protein